MEVIYYPTVVTQQHFLCPVIPIGISNQSHPSPTTPVMLAMVIAVQKILRPPPPSRAVGMAMNTQQTHSI
eukprot:11044434-Ditylum_brightwellii.AAC.1